MDIMLFFSIKVIIKILQNITEQLILHQNDKRKWKIISWKLYVQLRRMKLFYLIK